MSTFRRTGSVLELHVFALGLAPVPVRFAVFAADWRIHLWARAKFGLRWLRRGSLNAVQDFGCRWLGLSHEAIRNLGFRFGIETSALQHTKITGLKQMLL